MARFDWLKKFWGWLRGATARGRAVAERISALAEWALPAVELVARLTPTPTDDLLLAALRSLGYSARQILESSDDLFRDAARQRLAIEIIRRNLAGALQAGPVKIGDLTISTVEDILSLDKTQLLAAIHAVLAIVRAERG